MRVSFNSQGTAEVMEQFIIHTGVAAALNRNNVDTDAIIPKQFLKSIHRTGFGQHLFDGWRYLDEGQPGVDCSKRPLNPDFELNQPQFKGATILVTGANFGCGSSREHAPWALQQYGIKAIVACSFADIFFNNCFKNAILPVVLSESNMSQLFDLITTRSGLEMTVNLPEQTVSMGHLKFSFEVEPFRKHCLLNGLDDIGLTLQHSDEIKVYEVKRLSQFPWLSQTI